MKSTSLFSSKSPTAKEPCRYTPTNVSPNAPWTPATSSRSTALSSAYGVGWSTMIEVVTAGGEPALAASSAFRYRFHEERLRAPEVRGSGLAADEVSHAHDDEVARRDHVHVLQAGPS